MLTVSETAVDFEAVQACLREAFSLSQDQAQGVNLMTRAADLKQWDSMGHMALVTLLEERFNLTFEDDEVPTLTSVAAIVNALEKRS